MADADIMGEVLDAMQRLKNAPPLLTEIKVGSMELFKAHLWRCGCQRVLSAPAPHGSFAGLPIRVSSLFPENIAVVMRGNEVAYIIKLDRIPAAGSSRMIPK